MKKLWLISEKEIIETISKRVFYLFLIFFIIYAGYLNFLSLEIYTNISNNTVTSPQLIMSADPNQGIIAPLFSNFFLFFLLIFPIIFSTAISSEKENKTFDILKLNFNENYLVIGKFIAYLLLSFIFFIITFMILFPYIFGKGFVDINYFFNLFYGFFSISLLWVSLILFISAISPYYLSFYIVLSFNILILGLDFISDIIKLPFLDYLRVIFPYNYYDNILKGIFNLKMILLYIISGIMFLYLTSIILKNKKYKKIIFVILIYIISIIFISKINYKKDFTFNKINSLSETSIKLLKKVKQKKIIINLYIKRYGAKYQTALDLIKLYELSFNNIKFNFINPETTNKEYGIVEFIYKNRKKDTLSIDESIFTENIYYVASGKHIKVHIVKKNVGKPFFFRKKLKTYYIIWILFLITFIIYLRKIIINKTLILL